MKVIVGDLLKEIAYYDYIMHGCNCFHAMGGGIARTIREAYPGAAQVDRMAGLKGDPSKLGTHSLYVGENAEGDTIRIINLYTQFNRGPDFIPSIFPYAIRRINEEFKGSSIAIPLIGCGIGGGDWEFVQNVILTEGREIDWTVVVWKGTPNGI